MTLPRNRWCVLLAEGNPPTVARGKDGGAPFVAARPTQIVSQDDILKTLDVSDVVSGECVNFSTLDFISLFLKENEC